MTSLTHINNAGEANMVDIGDKANTKRIAIAQAHVQMQPNTLAMIQDGQHKKGDVFATARIAGIQAAKKCSDLIPLCHPLMLTRVQVDIGTELEKNRVTITSTCELHGKTGVEMEALTSVTVAALTIYDMCKAVDKTMVISSAQVIKKSGGKSGDWEVATPHE